MVVDKLVRLVAQAGARPVMRMRTVRGEGEGRQQQQDADAGAEQPGRSCVHRFQPLVRLEKEKGEKMLDAQKIPNFNTRTKSKFWNVCLITSTTQGEWLQDRHRRNGISVLLTASKACLVQLVWRIFV